MMVYTMKSQLRTREACEERYNYLCTWAPEEDDHQISLLEILDRNGPADAIWALRACDGSEDISRWLARWSALSVLHLWDAPDVVRTYLRTGDEELRGAAENAARYAAGNADRYAAGNAARVAARYAAGNAARYAVCARAAAWAKSGNCLRRLLMDGIPSGDITDEMALYGELP